MNCSKKTLYSKDKVMDAVGRPASLVNIRVISKDPDRNEALLKVVT